MKKFLLSLLAASFFLSSCNQIADNKLKVVTCADNPPFEFVKNGKIIGFDIDLIKEVAKLLGREIEIENVDFTGLILSLITERVEVAIAALTPTEVRAKSVDFTKNYLEAEMAALFRSEMIIPNDEAMASKIIGAQFGTTWAEYANKMIDSKVGGKTKFLPNSQLLVQELLNKNVDIIIMEQYQAIQYTIINPELTFFVLPNTSTNFSIAVKKNSPLTAKINDILTLLNNNGFIEDLKNKWF